MPELDPFSSKLADAPRVPVPNERTAVIMVDLVNDFIEPDGAMPMPDSTGTLAKAKELSELGREVGALLVWVRPGHTEDVDGLFRKRIPHGFSDTRGAQIHDSLSVQAGERIVTKRRYSAFFQTDLDLYLREHRIERVIVCGVALNICVRSTIHDAFFNGYDVWLASDASQATGGREAESTMYDIRTHFGDILTVDEIRTQLTT